MNQEEIETESRANTVINNLFLSKNQFEKRLGQLLKVASVENRNRIRKALPEYWYDAFYQTGQTIYEQSYEDEKDCIEESEKK